MRRPRHRLRYELQGTFSPVGRARAAWANAGFRRPTRLALRWLRMIKTYLVIAARDCFPVSRIPASMHVRGAVGVGVEGRMPAAISCVTVPVDDLQKSIAFYRDGLGLAVEESDEDHAVFDLDG